MARGKSLKTKVDEQLAQMLDSDEEPSEGRMKLLAIAIKKLALDAKLEENIYGEYFNPDEPGLTPGDAPGPKSHPRKRTDDGDPHFDA